MLVVFVKRLYESQKGSRTKRARGLSTCSSLSLRHCFTTSMSKCILVFCIDKRRRPLPRSAKYAQDDDRSTLALFFESHQGIVSSDQAGSISKIIENVSYSKEVKRIAAGQQTFWHETCLELHWYIELPAYTHHCSYCASIVYRMPTSWTLWVRWGS